LLLTGIPLIPWTAPGPRDPMSACPEGCSCEGTPGTTARNVGTREMRTPSMSDGPAASIAFWSNADTSGASRARRCTDCTRPSDCLRCPRHY
jgi:hypothetical protein